MQKLTIKQEKFVLKYFECGNATEAYKHAYSTLKMKDKTINENASRLLADSKITARLKELQNKAQKESEWNVKKLLSHYTEVVNIGFGNKASPHIVTNDTGKSTSETKVIELKDTNLSAVLKALIEIGKLIGAYDKENREKEGEMDILSLLKRVAK